MARMLRTKVGLVLAALLMIGSLATAAPAQAGSPIVYNQRGSYVAGRACASVNCPVDSWLPNSQHFYMRCWVDNQYFTGNYGSVRWFGGYTQAGRWVLVHSSYVYYQTSVGRC